MKVYCEECEYYKSIGTRSCRFEWLPTFDKRKGARHNPAYKNALNDCPDFSEKKTSPAKNFSTLWGLIE